MSRVFSGVVLSGSFSGSATGMTVPDGSIGTNKIADGAVTSLKIQDSSVTGPKIADGAVTGLKIANKAVKANHIDVRATYVVDPDGDLTIGYE